MASSGGLWAVAFFLVVQVLPDAVSTSPNAPPRKLITGTTYPGGSHPGQVYPRPEYPEAFYPAPEHTGPDYPEPEYFGKAYPRPEYPGPAYPEPEYPRPAYPWSELPGLAFPWLEYAASRQHPKVRGPPKRGPKPSEENSAVFIGNDIEMPYLLYKQIIESYKSSDTILCLLPSNTVRSVAGYAELKDTVKAHGTDTKVIISKEIMIPADVYLRIVVLNPEEVMVQLPSGEVIPNIIFQEQLGKKVEVQNQGGQKYYAEVPQSEYDHFLIEGNTRKPGYPRKPELHSRSGFHGTEESPEPQEDHDPPPSQRSSHKPEVTSTYYEAPPKNRYHPFTYSAIPQQPTAPPSGFEALPLSTLPSQVDIQPIVLIAPEFDKLPHNRTPLPRGNHLHPYATPTHFQYYGVTPHFPESRGSLGEQRPYLPPGTHFIDTARCHTCDPSSHAPHFLVFNV